MEAQELKLVSTQELLDEICTRYDEVVFKAYRLNSQKTGNYTELKRLQGNYHICQGLCFQLMLDVEKARQETIKKDNL